MRTDTTPRTARPQLDQPLSRAARLAEPRSSQPAAVPPQSRWTAAHPVRNRPAAVRAPNPGRAAARPDRMSTMTTSTTQAADQRYAGTDNDAYRAMRIQLQAFIARRVESTQVAEDLTQEVLLRLVRSNADELADPAAWLYRVARNVIIDHYRTRRPDPARVEASELIKLGRPLRRRPIACPPRTRPMPALTHQPARRAIPDPRSPPWTSTGEPTPPSPPRPG